MSEIAMEQAAGPHAVQRDGVLDSLPGHLMMWVLIFSELAAFGALLAAFSLTRALHPAMFAGGQGLLDPVLAAANTFILILSGWCAARACAAARHDRPRPTRRWIGAACALGVAFIAVKLFEYAGDIERGLDFEASTFATLYYLLTGFHLLHVALGVVILAAVAWRAEAVDVETGAAFWHMVDLIWLLMFPIVYLMR